MSYNNTKLEDHDAYQKAKKFINRAILGIALVGTIYGAVQCESSLKDSFKKFHKEYIQSKNINLNHQDLEIIVRDNYV